MPTSSCCFASELAKDAPFTQQNIGLIYVEFKQYDQARASAQRVIDLGERPEQLIDALTQVGEWREAAAPAASGSGK